MPITYRRTISNDLSVSGGGASGEVTFFTGPSSLSGDSSLTWDNILKNLSTGAINKVTITVPASGSTLTVADGKTLTVSNTLTFTGTDSSSINCGAGGTIAYVIGPTTFTPTVTLVGGAGNTVPQYVTNSARYTQIGRRVFCDVLLSGDGGNEGAGTGQINIALPVTASASAVGNRTPIGYYLNGGTATMLGGTVAASATTVALTVGQGTTSFTGADQSNTTRVVTLRFDYEV